MMLSRPIVIYPPNEEITAESPNTITKSSETCYVGHLLRITNLYMMFIIWFYFSTSVTFLDNHTIMLVIVPNGAKDNEA